jgi:cyclopropane-fatty-acyl-phospholipid synthase
MGFDDRFIRTWDYYLAACEAGFLTRNTSDLQIVFDKPGRTLRQARPERVCDRDPAALAGTRS